VVAIIGAVSLTSGECRMYTAREGALSAVGHDLALRAARWRVEVDRAARAVTARVTAASVTVVDAMRGGAVDPGVLSAGDRAKIDRVLRDDVFAVERFPDVVFEGRWVGDDPTTVAGALTLRGVARPLTVRVSRANGRVVGTATVHQPTWGITPFRAMLGALRVHSDVRVEWVVEGVEENGQ
jgi:polyisoprenoid-binding protein YceI